jgi:cephalosporin-C deacetylase-like acetyl esterase
MKPGFVIVALQLSFFTGTVAQNLISPLWKISFTDTSGPIRNQTTIADWKDVNLLLSWERQGYFWNDGTGCIVKDFTIPEGLADSQLVLSVSLQCDVKRIYINDTFIGGNLPNQFWTHRGATAEFPIASNCLHRGKQNRISIVLSNLSYTGGRSYNRCSLAPAGAKSHSEVLIDIPAKDHLYSVEDPNSFSIKYTAIHRGTIELTVVNDFHDPFVQKEYEVEEGTGVIRFDCAGFVTQSGFYECYVVMNDGGYSSDVRWFALSPERIDCTNNTTPRFKEYWGDALAELGKVNPECNVTRVESLCTAGRDGYIAEMKSFGGLTIRGYYFVPKSPRRHAAVLHVPGYGYGWQHLGVFLESREDVVELALCVRGHGISADVFNPGFGVPGVWGYRLCREIENAYRAIYLDCVRAVEFLAARPEVDASRIGVMGGSQGGGLALATAGLCNDKIKACSYFDPFPCDTRDHLKIRTMCNTEIRNYLKFYDNECSFEDALHVQDLIDTKGFAGWIRCPVFFLTSLFDDDSPPHLGFSAYSKISAPKRFKIFPEDSHLNEKVFGEQMQFLKSELGF